MTRKLLKLAYPSFERFKKDYAYIQKGMLFVPMSKPLPLHTMLYIQIVIPGIEETFMTHGEIVKSYDRENPLYKEMMSGVVLTLDGDGQSLKAEIEMALRSREDYRKLLEVDAPVKSPGGKGFEPAGSRGSMKNPPENLVPAPAAIRTAAQTPSGTRLGFPREPQAEIPATPAPPKVEPIPTKTDREENGLEGIALSSDLLSHLNGSTTMEFKASAYPPDAETPPIEDVVGNDRHAVDAGDSGSPEPAGSSTPVVDGAASSTGSITSQNNRLSEDDALILKWIHESAGPDAAPPDAGLLLDPRKMACDIHNRGEEYLRRIQRTGSKGDALVFHKWYQRAIPVLIEAGHWPVLRDITRAANQLAANEEYFPDLSNPTVNPFVLTFYEHTDSLASAYENAKKDQRPVIDDLVDELGYVGVKILSGILHESEKRDARTAAVASLGRKGELALHWVRLLLDDPTKKWYLYRNGLLILSHVGTPDEDMNRVRPFLEHPHERVREEAFKTAIVYMPGDIDKIITRSLKDSDRHIRIRASMEIDRITWLSSELFGDIMDFLLAEPPKDLSEASGYYRSCSHLIRFLGDRDPIPQPDQFESVLMKMVVKFLKIRKWFAILVNSDEYEEINRVLTTSVNILEKIGSPRARAFLREAAAHSKD